MSKTRQKFYASRAAKRKQRAYDVWWSEHHFWCHTCKFETRFGYEVAGAQATCRRCKTVHVYYEGPVEGRYTRTWLTAAQHGELFIPDESMTTLESVYREIDTEKNVSKDGYMQQLQETIVIADHAPWCGSPDVPIIGLRAKMGAPGRVRWTDSGGRVRHLCQSSAAAKNLASARWEAAR